MFDLTTLAQIDFFGISAFFGGLLSSIISAIQAVLIFLLNIIQAVYQFLLTGLTLAVQFLFRVFGHVGRFFRNLWDGVIKKGLLKLIDLYDRLMTKLERILRPVLRWIEKIRALIDKWYFRLFGPILNAIQSVRRVLQIFRIFNLKWARALDEKFLRLEQRLLAPYLLLRDKINEIINWLALPTALGTLIKGNVILASLGQVWGVLQGIFHTRMNRALTIEEEASQKNDRERFTKANIIARADERAKNGLTADDKDFIRRSRNATLEISGLESNQLPPIPT